MSYKFDKAVQERRLDKATASMASSVVIIFLYSAYLNTVSVAPIMLSVIRVNLAEVNVDYF